MWDFGFGDSLVGHTSKAQGCAMFYSLSIEVIKVLMVNEASKLARKKGVFHRDRFP